MQTEFRKWMDARKLTAAEVGEALGVSAQTVRIWRSQGIPPRREPHVAKLMEEWETRQRAAAELGKLILRPSEDQFRRWNRASITGPRPQTVEDWAMDALEAAAAEDLEAESGLKVAEEPPEYRAQEKRSGE